MCGIVGIIAAYNNGFNQTELKVFKDMLFLDTLRGWDSTGVFGVSNKGNVKILKEATQAGNFIRTKEYDKFEKEAWDDGIFLVGHNRAATRGEVNDKNAHPFWPDDKLVLVHNGTYWGDHKKLKDTEVDTEAIAHTIMEHPDDVEAALNKINAAYALVWYNVEQKKLNLIRNNARPLYVAEAKSGAVVWASEAETIIYACGRNKIDLKDVPTLLEAGTLLTYELDTKTAQHIKEVKKVDYAYKAPPTTLPFRGADHHVPARPVRLAYSKNTEYQSIGHKEMTIHEYVFKHQFLKYKATDPEADALKEFLFKKEPRRKMYIEMVDYLPVKDVKDNDNWIVYGVSLGTDEGHASPIVYFFMNNKTEEEVMDFVSKVGFVEVEIPSAHPVDHTVAGNDGKYRVITLFASNPVALQTPTVLETEDYVH